MFFVLKIWCLNDDIVLDRLPRSCFCAHRRYEWPVFKERLGGNSPALEWRKKSLQLQNSLTKMNLQMFFLGGLEGWDIPTCSFLDCTWKWMVCSCHLHPIWPAKWIRQALQLEEFKRTNRIRIAAVDGWWSISNDMNLNKCRAELGVSSGPWYLAIG